MADPRCQDPKVKVCIRLIDRLCRENHLVIHMNFPDDHPVEEVGRVLLALLIKYQGIESLIEQLVEQEIENPGSGTYIQKLIQCIYKFREIATTIILYYIF